jgi:iron complex transport system ATP-binding protein
MTGTIAIDGLSVALKGRRVLDSVTVQIKPGALIGLIGPNGAGKSTLLKTLAGLIASDAGSISLDSHVLQEIDAATRAKRIAYIPQERTLAWPLPARAIVALGRLPHQGPRTLETAEDMRAIDAAMAAMDVSAFAERPSLELSGGERARVLIARALAQESDILFADEPAAGLDPAHQFALFEHLSKLAEAGRIVVVALHDLMLAARFAPQIILMSQGRIVAAGSCASVLTAKRLSQVYGIAAQTVMVDGRPMLVPVGLQK